MLNFSELHAHQRKQVARLFLEVLVECPRSLWDPALMVIDERQIFASERDTARVRRPSYFSVTGIWPFSINQPTPSGVML